MLYISCEDLVMKRGRKKQLENKTRMITNISLYGGSIALVGLGIINIGVIANCIILGIAGKVTKLAIKKSGVLKLIKSKKVVEC